LVYAESNNKYVKNQDNSILICNAENLKMIAPEEYFKIIANARNISVTEAEKITKEIIKEHQKYLIKYNKIIKNKDKDEKFEDILKDPGITIQSIDWGPYWTDNNGGKYFMVTVYKQQDVGGGILIEVGVPGIIYVYGTYARQFVSIDSSACYAQPVSSGYYIYNVFVKSASLSSDKTKVYLYTRGNVEITVQKSEQLGITIEELIQYGFSYVANYTYRKTVSISHTESLY
jgi:hypothetical protein